MKATSQDWDKVRTAFASSIMVDTSLSSLAQNLDGPDWPIKSKSETPADYIDLNLEEVVELLALKGQQPERVDQLVGLLQDTMAFDQPFGEMVAQTQAAEARDNPILKNLAKLGIPASFPLNLTTLGEETLDFCRHEKLATLAEFAVFAQGLAQNVIVGGDFRTLLNALSHIDEAALAAMLPYRPGAKGVHLVEALGQAARSSQPEARASLATTWFQDDLVAIGQEVAAGNSLARQFVTLGNPVLEEWAAALLRPYLKGTAAKAGTTPGRKRGFFARLFGK